MKYKLILLLSVLLNINMVHAQWHFSITSMNYNDNCGDLAASIEVSVRVQAAEDAAKKTYSTQEECESNRSWAKVNYSSHGCYLRVTSSPCTGGNIGGGDIGGGLQSSASQHSSIAIGESYFSPTIVQEIPEMGHELEIKLEALNKSRNNAVKGIKTGDHSFDEIYKRQTKEMPKSKNEDIIGPYTFRSRNEIDWDKAVVIPMDSPTVDIVDIKNANYSNVQSYFEKSESLTSRFLDDPSELESLLLEEFARVSGIDVIDVRNKRPEEWTKEEQQALSDYEAYRLKEMEQMNKELDNSKEKKEMDAAILAWDVYGKGSSINQTNYRKLDLESLSTDGFPQEHSSILTVAETIKECNDTESTTGFHAELYYNEVTNTYVISCAGSDDYEDWKYNNAPNALGGDVPQYILAKVIGDAINSIPQAEREKLNIEIVGHSLGGGDASIIGLITGLETKTFNAAKVPDNFLKENGLYDKVNTGDVQNITAYHTSSDVLTNLQNSVGTPAIGISVDIGDPRPEPIKSTLEPSRDRAAFEFGSNVYNSLEEHLIQNVVTQMNNKNKKELDKINFAQTRLQIELGMPELEELINKTR